MNAPTATITDKGDYLIVTEIGERTSLLDIVEDVKTVYEAAKAYDNKYLLVDFHQVNNIVPQTDAFNLVRIFESKFPDLSDLTFSYITNAENLQLVKFWEHISNQRGFKIKVFTNFDEAQNWLISEIIKVA